MGIYFEACLFGARNTSPPPGYDIWLTSNRTKQTRERIKIYANECRSKFSLDTGLTDVTMEVDFSPALKLNIKGVADYIGEFDDIMPMSVVDVKFTKDIYETWSITKGTMKLIQAPMYSIMYAILNGDTDKYMSLMAEFVGHRMRSVSEIPSSLSASMRDWVQQSPTPVPVYYIVENTFGSQDFDDSGDLIPCGPPLTKTIVIDIHWMDYFTVPFDLSRYSSYYDDMVERHKKKLVTSSEIDPNPEKCLGKGNKEGRCPYLHSCPFAREVLYGTQSTNINNIL